MFLNYNVVSNPIEENEKLFVPEHFENSVVENLKKKRIEVFQNWGTATETTRRVEYISRRISYETNENFFFENIRF